MLGPDSSLGPMIAATIAPLVLAGGDPDKAVALASVLAVLVGVVMTVAGLGHLGFVADLLSKPTQIGYMNGLALTIVVGQLPKLFGFSVDADGLIEEATAFVTGVADQLVNATAATIGVLSLVGILLMQRLMPKIPAVLVVVVLAALAVNLLDLQDDGVKTIGVLPQGFPPFTIPTVAWGDLPELFLGAVAIAVVALADTMSTSSSFAARRGERVNGDQEMIGIGAANILAGLFQGFPVSTSGSRTAVSEQAGSRSQVTGIVGAVVIAFVLVFATGVMQYVPQPTLGAIVIAAALSLADLPATRRLWHQRRTEFALSIAAFLGVALLGVLPGILLVDHVDLVPLAIADTNEGRDIASEIEQRVQFDSRLGRTERRPREHRKTQIDGGGIESVDGLFELDSKRFVGVKPPCHRNQTVGEVAVDAPVPSCIGIGQSVARHGRANTQVIELGGLSAKTGFDIAQALAKRQLRKDHREILIQTTEALNLVMSTITRHTATKGC